ncbi:MAG: methyltransferase domain-containing protein [Methylocystis sp.]
MLTTPDKDSAHAIAATAAEAKLSVTVIILTFNEELHLERCIASVSAFAQQVIVIDSFSSDRTVEIAERLGAMVTQRAFKHQADQFQWALDNCQITTDWVLRLDADEYVEPALAKEIMERVPGLPRHVTGVRLRRKVIFRDRWIRHGGYYPAILLRLWRTGAAAIEQRWMDEYAILIHGEGVTFEKDFVDHNLRDITWWTDKHNRYATRHMLEFINREFELYPSDEAMDRRAQEQSPLKRFVRNRLYTKAPLYLRSVFFFIYRYVFRLGFLDGRAGFLFQAFQCLWYYLLIDAKIEEARIFIRKYGINAFRQRLVDHYNIELTTENQSTDQPGQAGSDALKERVRGHWEQETCGTRYGEATDRLAWFRDIARSRLALEPYIGAFAGFEEAAGKRVLEIGVGAGADFIEWCRHAEHATGVDLTEAGIALTAERLALEGIPANRFTLTTADAEALPFADASFDIVYSWGVLHHTPGTEQAYREVSRVLKPGGVARTMVYHSRSWTALMLYLSHGLAKGRPFLGLKRAVFEHLESPGTKAYTQSEGYDLARAAGFENVRVETKLGPGDLLEIKPSARYRGALARIAWRLYPRPLIRLLGDRFGLYLLIEGHKPLSPSETNPCATPLASRNSGSTETIKPSVLVLLGAFWPRHEATGPNQSFHAYASALRDEFEFRVVGRDGPPGVHLDGAYLERWVDNGTAKMRHCSVGLLGATGLTRILRTTPYDLLILNGFFDRAFTIPALVLRKLGLIPRRPTILTPHGEFSNGALGLKPMRKQAYLRAARALGLLDDVSLHATTDQEAIEIREGCPWARDIVVAPTVRELIPSPQLASSPDKSPLRLVFLSRIDTKKNLDYAIKVLRKVRAPVKFDIIGPVSEPSYWTECEELIRQLPAHVEVNYLGSISNADVASTLAQYDLFLLPTRGENFGHAIFDALEVGLPILISDQTPWHDLEKKGAGWDLPLAEPDRFAEIIDRMATFDASRRDELRRAARSLAEASVKESDAVPLMRAMLTGALSRTNQTGSGFQNDASFPRQRLPNGA